MMKEKTMVDVRNQEWCILPLIFITATCLLAAWLAQFHWKRRDLYRKAARIPGPIGYPLIGSALEFCGPSNEGLIKTCRRLFKNNPPIFKFWLGPKLITVVSKPEHLEIVLNHPQCLKKGELYWYFEAVFGQGLISAPVDIWKVHRKMINPTFNPKILDSFMEVFNKRAKILTKVVAQKLGDENLDVSKVIDSFNIDIICETAMGIQIIDETTTNNYASWVDQHFEIACMRAMTIYYHSDWIFNFTRYKKLSDDSAAKINDYIREVVLHKRKMFEDRKEQLKNGFVIEENAHWKCFLDHLIELSDKGETLTDKELIDEVSTFMTAGSGTNSTSLCYLLVIMGMYPEVQKKIYEEVIDVLGYDRDVTQKDLPRLQYMDRCIKESLRILPTVPLIVRTPCVDIEVDGTILPANCTLGLAIMETHSSEKYWKDPLKFDPDRFLPEEVAKRHPYSYIPFSGGPRGCIGYKFSVMVTKTALSHIIRNFVVKTQYKSIEEIDLAVHVTLKPTEGFKMSLHSRELM